MGNILKMIVLSIFVLQTYVISAQSKYMSKDGNASFFSEALLEDIEAHSKEAQSVIDLSTQKVVVKIPISSFHFDKSLMEEHFNENYMETEKYPNALFDGVYSAATPIEAGKDGTYQVEVSGKLTIHGVTNEIKTEGTIEIKDGKLISKTVFPVKLEDYKIKIPKIVFKNIAEVVEVKIDMLYNKFES